MHDLRNSFARIRAEADRQDLPMAEQLRHRSDQRARRRATAGILAAVVAAVAGLAGLLPLTGPDAPPPITGQSATPPPSATPTPSASQAAPSKPVGCLDRYPGLIPSTVFLADATADTALCYRAKSPPPGEPTFPTPDYLPRVCATMSHPSDSLITDRRGIEVMFNDGTDTSPSTSRYFHTVTQYSGSGAQDYLAELRQAVGRCDGYPRDGTRYEYAIVSGPKLGDEAIRMTVYKRLTQTPESGPREGTFYISVVRRGHYVSVVFDRGWEGHPTRSSVIFDVMEKASERLPDR